MYDDGASFTSSIGVNGAPVHSADATGGVTITDVPATGHVVIDDLIIATKGVSMLLTLQTSGGAIIGYIDAPTSQITTRGRWKSPTAGQALKIVSSVSGDIYVTALWHSEP